MRLIRVTVIFILISSYNFCLAQNNQSESITISTYYPAPYGVYKNPRLVPLNSKPACSYSDPNCDGTMYFNSSDQTPYLFVYNFTLSQGKWEKIGSGASGVSSLMTFSGHHVSPDRCSSYMECAEQLCEEQWYKTITFPKRFKNPPQVIVVMERNPDNSNTPCANNTTDYSVAYAANVKTTGFRIYGYGSPGMNVYCGGPTTLEGRRTRAEVGWLAIGERE